MGLRLAFSFFALLSLACASPSSENAAAPGEGEASSGKAPIGQTADATVSGDVAPSPTPARQIAVRADSVPTVLDDTSPKETAPVVDKRDAGVIAPDAWGAPPASTGARVDGSPCTTGAECSSGMCEGEGCGTDEGRCMPKERACTKDLKAFCGCDGKTFRGSGTCPKRTWRTKGACQPS